MGPAGIQKSSDEISKNSAGAHRIKGQKVHSGQNINIINFDN